jgi:hypothetical protein
MEVIAKQIGLQGAVDEKSSLTISQYETRVGIVQHPNFFHFSFNSGSELLYLVYMISMYKSFKSGHEVMSTKKQMSRFRRRNMSHFG